jgi:hypothetical protein
MEDDADHPAPPPVKQLSRTPSWLLLGFLLGASFVWLLPHPETKPVPPARREPAPAAAAAAPREKRDLTVIEAVFAEWGGAAIWEHDLTEVALWDSEAKAFSQCYEVLRSGGNFYYRPIDRLTRPVLTHGGLKPDSPLRLTETAAMREEWLREKSQEDWKAIKDSIAPRAPGAATPDGKP